MIGLIKKTNWSIVEQDKVRQESQAKNDEKKKSESGR